MKRTLWLVLVLAALGCGAGSPKSYSLDGQWALSGAVSGAVVDITQTGDTISGTVLALNGENAGSLYGTNANGNVIFTLALLNYTGTIATSYLPGSTFSGHFTNPSTVVGQASGHQLTLTRE
jgi:hypothetical protein